MKIDLNLDADQILSGIQLGPDCVNAFVELFLRDPKTYAAIVQRHAMRQSQELEDLRSDFRTAQTHIEASKTREIGLKNRLSVIKRVVENMKAAESDIVLMSCYKQLEKQLEDI
jgi:hypothetical protein